MLAAFFVAATMASIGLPGFANFWGELTIFVSLSALEPFWPIAFVVVSIIISAIYGLRAVAKIFFGARNPNGVPAEEFEKIKDISGTERVPAILLFAALLVVGFVPSILTKNLNQALAETFPSSCEISLEGEELDDPAGENPCCEESAGTAAE